MRKAKHYKLDDRDDGNGRRLHFVCSLDGVQPERRRSTVTITRTGVFSDPRYGRFEISREVLLSMVRNFEARTYGQDIFIDVAHEPDKGAAAEIKGLSVEGSRLRADVEWTDYGVRAIRERGFRYLSAEFVDEFQDNESGRSHGPVLLGAGLTIRPVIKRLDPVTLSESHPRGPVFLHPDLERQLTLSLERTTMKWIDELKRRLAQRKLSEAASKALIGAYEAAAKTLGEDDKAHEALVDQLDEHAKTLAEATPGTPVQLSVNTPAAKLDESALSAAVTKALSERDTAAKALQESRDKLRQQFTAALEGAKGLSEETRTRLSASVELVTEGWTEAQVKALAEQQIALGEQLEAARQLSSIGFAGPAGSPRISADESNTIRKLSETIRKNLCGTSAFANRAPVDEAKLPPFVRKVLGEFDRVNGRQLHEEAKMLSGGVVNTGDTSLPASYQREVILETLSDLRVLELVDADVDPTSSATHNVPYETRDTAAVYNDGVVYEGQPIHQGGVSQANFIAYIEPVKIAMELTNEVIFFSRNNANINWDAYARNVASNSRLARELIARRLANQMQRASDTYGAEEVSAEAFDGQLDGSTSLIKTAEFPIVRPYQARDLQGNTVGSAECPITLTLNGVAISAWDGTGDQAAGTYYVVENYNLGLIRLVDEAGTAVTPADTGVNTITYWSATNVALQDTDLPGSTTYEQHMNKLLQKFGSQKAVLSQDRFVKANFGLLSEVLHNMVTDAESFTAQARRDGTDTTAMGDLARIKGVDCWGTNAPAIDLGEERILLGERGVVKYRIAKPWQLGAPFEVMNSAGRPVGKKAAYGEEYSSICVPTPLRARLTSVVAYSATARTNAA